MRSSRLTDIIGEWVSHAVEKYALGDRFTWDMVFVLTEDGPKVLLVVFLPGVVLGNQLQAAVSIESHPALTDAEVYETVRRAMERLRTERSRQMGLVRDGDAPVAANGATA